MIVDKLNDILNTNNHDTTSYIISKFIKNNITMIHTMTIDEVAKGCYVSKGQISKYVKNLEFETYGEFKSACLEYYDSIKRKDTILSSQNNVIENSKEFTLEINKSLQFLVKEINYSILNIFINEIKESPKIYIYAQGDARSLCHLFQSGCGGFDKEVIICDADFIKEIVFEESDILIIISTNGQSFYYDQRRIIKRLKEANVRKWIITCDKNIEFSSEKLIIPSYNKKYNEFALRHILDIVIANLQTEYS